MRQSDAALEPVRVVTARQLARDASALLDDAATRVLECLLETPNLDSVIASTGLGVAVVSRAVSRLEMQRLVIREAMGVKLSRLGRKAAAAVRARGGN